MRPARLYNDGETIQLLDNANVVLYTFEGFDDSDSYNPKRLLVTDTQKLMIYGAYKTDEALWESENAGTEAVLTAVDIISVVMNDVDDEMLDDCDKSLATSTSIFNYGSNPITYTDSISWEASSAQTSSYDFNMETTLGATFSGGFMCGNAEFSASISFGYSKSTASTKTKTYSFSKDVETVTPSNTFTTTSLLACIIEDQTIAFTATIRYTYSDGTITYKTVKGKWTGTTYANYKVTQEEQALTSA